MISNYLNFLVPDFLTGGSSSKSQTDHDLIAFAAMVIICMLMFYISVGIYIEQNQFSFGHEASITIVVGILISCI